MEFIELASTWKEARLQLAEKRVALIEATHDLKGTEADAWAQEGGIPGRNEAARKAALFIIAYPEVELVNSLKAEIIMLEVEVDYRKAFVNNAINNNNDGGMELAALHDSLRAVQEINKPEAKQEEGKAK